MRQSKRNKKKGQEKKLNIPQTKIAISRDIIK